MVLGEAQAQVGEPEEPAEILLRHDLGDARFIGVRGHVIVRRVVEVLDKTIISCGVLAVELLPEEFVGVLGGGEKVQAVWWIRPTDIAGVDLEDAVPGPRLADEVWQGLILVRDILEGFRDEVVEVVAVGDLLLDVEDGEPELLQQAILVLLLPLREVQEVVGAWVHGWLAYWKLLSFCGRRQVHGVGCCHDERLLRRDEVGLLNPWTVGVEAMWTVVPPMLLLDAGVRRYLPKPALVVHHGLAANLPADVMLLHGVRNLGGPLGEVVVRLDALEESMAIPVRVQRGLDGVLVPLSERRHYASAFRLR